MYGHPPESLITKRLGQHWAWYEIARASLHEICIHEQVHWRELTRNLYDEVHRGAIFVGHE